MNKPAKPKVILILLAFYAVSFCLMLAYGAFRVVGDEVILPNFKLAYGLRWGIALFLEHLIAIHVSAILIAYSLFFSTQTSSAAGGAWQPFYGLVTGALATLIFLTAIYTFLALSISPLVHRGLDETRTLSRFAGDIIEKAEKLEEANQTAPAIRQYNLYLSIDTQNETVKKHRTELMVELAQSRAKVGKDRETPPLIEPEHERDAEAYLDKARDFFETEDFLSAYYYAGLAAELDKSSLTAEPLKAEIWKRIVSTQTSRADAEATKHFENKLAGHNALVKKDFVTAYYTFRELNRTYPQDPEIADFLQKSLEGLRETVFFLDDVEKNLILPGMSNIVFMNSITEQEREIVRIGRVVSSPEGWFFRDIEAVRFDDRGIIKYHLRAPYGKLISGHISLKCRDRHDREERDYLPEYAVGNAGEMGGFLLLSVDVRFLPYLNPEAGDTASRDTASRDTASRDTASRGTARMGISELFNAGQLYDQAGYDRRGAEIEILMRLLNPFLFLVLSLLAISLGWAYRARYLSRPPIVTYLLVPGLPFLLSYIVALFRQAHRVILGYLLISTGFEAALTVLIVSELVLMVIGLLMLAGQRTD